MDTVDRISELPDPILHHILSSLPLQQVVQTIVLSKRWKQSLDTFPNLEYAGCDDDFDRNKMILRYMEQTLLNRCTDRMSVNKFTLELQLPLDPEILTSVSRCLTYAIESNVKILNLSVVNVFYHPSWCNLPPIVFRSKSIDVLELSGCKLAVPTSNVMLYSLRRLCLRHVAADDSIIENVVAGSPLIEHLEISCCRGLTSLELASLNRLKTVIVSGNYALRRLKIDVPSVREIDISNLLSSCEISLACQNIKCLRLCDLLITSNWLCNEISKCPHLEFLSINHCSALESIKVSNHSLRTLCIFDCSDLFEVNIETPNLSIFKYGGDLISFSSIDLALAEADLYFDSEKFDTPWFVRYIELLAKFHWFSKALTLHSNTGESCIVPRELRKILRPPLFGASQLKLILHDEGRPFSELIDGLLWMSPHVETIFVLDEDEYKYGYLNNTTIQFSYKEEFIFEGGSETPCCCQSLPVSCWQHCIKEISMEISRTYLGKTIKAKRYSFHDGEFLEKIDGHA